MPIYFVVIRLSRARQYTEGLSLGLTIEELIQLAFNSGLITYPIARSRYKSESYDDRPKKLRCFHKSLYT